MSENALPKTISKVKKILIPYLLLLYTLNYIVKINIGFAALKMSQSLGLNAEQFGFAAGIYFISYTFLQIPSNVILNKIGARICISLIMLIVGVVSVLTGFVNSADSLYILRFLLGLAQAGFFPGIILYLTYWFPQREFAHAVALFMSALAFSNIIGPPISGIILSDVAWGKLESWRWLFILEGTPVILFSIVTYLILPNKPSEARFLSQEERKCLSQEITSEQKIKLKQTTLRANTRLDKKLWLITLIYLFGPEMGSFAVFFWVPTMIQGLSKNYSLKTIGFLAMIPFLFTAVAMIFVAKSADKKAQWHYYTQIPLLASVFAIFAITFSKIPFISIILISLIAGGAISAFGPFWALTNKVLSGSNTAVGVAIINSIGNLSGFFATYFIGYVKRLTDNLYYGLDVVGIFMMISAILISFLDRKDKEKLTSV
ncbi:MAG: MFS transporter [Conexivisphaerales archaeon]